MKEVLAGRSVHVVSREERCRVVLLHIKNFRDRLGEARANKEMRKHVSWYLRGLPKATEYRDRVFRSKSSEVLETIVKEALTG